MKYDKITISGRICTGKTTLFWSLQKKLGWPTFSASQFFRDYARNYGVSLQEGEEQNPDLTKKIDYGMQELLKKQDHVILEGWMAGIMADEIVGVLRICLTCEEGERVRRFADREGIDVKQAERKIREREENVYRRLKQIYKREDFLDPKNYDLVIDTSRKKPQEVLALVLKKLNL